MKKEQFGSLLFYLVPALLVALLLAFLGTAIDKTRDSLMYVTTWVVFLHLCIGVYILLRHTAATGMVHQVADGMGGLLLVAGVLMFRQPAVWCAFFAGLFGIAATKYALLLKDSKEEFIRKYAREKLWWESPMVLVLAAFSVLFVKYEEARLGFALRVILLVGAVAFAVLMIAIRRSYFRIAKRAVQEGPASADNRQSPA